MPQDKYDEAPQVRFGVRCPLFSSAGVVNLSLVTDNLQDGVYVYGLYLEGARWHKDVRSLADSIPKVLHTSAPIIWFRPVQQNDSTTTTTRDGAYECPVYKTR